MRCSPAATERKTAQSAARARDVAAFLRTGAVSLSIVVSGERLSQTANRLQLLVFDHCHASGRRVSRVANRMP